MSPATTTLPPPAARESEDLEEVGLRARWKEEAGEGESRRDVLLRNLREGHRSTHDLAGISLVGEDLQGVDLMGCDLRGADLSRAKLSKAKLANCDLRGAILFGANLDGCECLASNLSGANLGECSAVRAGFGRANLEDAVLFQADLSRATFASARLCGADFRAAVLEGARLREADLSRAVFAAAQLRGAEFDQSDVRDCDFEKADLRDSRMSMLTNFDSATWIGADIRGMDVSGAYLLRRHVMDENYLFEFRSRSRYHRFVHALWSVTSDCGRSPFRWLAWNFGVALLFSCLYMAVDVDYGEYRTAFSPFYYSFVTLTTLGYGDVLPASAAAQVLAVSEVLLGYVGLGGLLSILANKMARRAE